MYLKWLEKKKFGYNIINEHKGDEAGIKSCTIKATGNYLYVLLITYIFTIIFKYV